MYIGTSFTPRGPSSFLVGLFIIGAAVMVSSAVLVGALVVACCFCAWASTKVYLDEMEKRRRQELEREQEQEQ